LISAPPAVSDADRSDRAHAAGKLLTAYNEGQCAGELPILEDNRIYTSACGMSDDELRTFLRPWATDAWVIQDIELAEYRAAVQRTEALRER
jgi:hypothetical protein